MSTPAGQVVPLNRTREAALSARPDDDLMLLCAAGHRAAFEVLVDRHLPSLSRFCTKLADSNGAGEEIAQDVLVELWNRSASYRPQGRFRAYLLRMARSRCLNELRSRHRRAGATESMTALVPPSDGSAVELLLEHERTRRVQREMARLPPKLREALLLRFDQELDYRDIASVAGTFESTARSRVFHGLRRLSDALAEEESS